MSPVKMLNSINLIRKFLFFLFNRAPLCENSPLKAELVPKVQEKTTKRNVKSREIVWVVSSSLPHSVLLHPITMFVIERFHSFVEDQMSTNKKKGPLEDQPVTFKTKIKSSGYTVTPRWVNVSLITASFPLPHICSLHSLFSTSVSSNLNM